MLVHAQLPLSVGTGNSHSASGLSSLALRPPKIGTWQQSACTAFSGALVHQLNTPQLCVLILAGVQLHNTFCRRPVKSSTSKTLAQRASAYKTAMFFCYGLLLGDHLDSSLFVGLQMDT